MATVLRDFIATIKQLPSLQDQYAVIYNVTTPEPSAWVPTKSSAGPLLLSWHRRARNARAILEMLALLGFAIMAGSHPGLAQTVTVNWSDVHQTIDGFGASSSFAEIATSTHALANKDFWWNPRTGLGLSILRVQAVPSDTDCTYSASGASYIDADDGDYCESSSGATILHSERLMAQAAASYGVTVFASPWSPPVSMKSGGSADGGSLNSGSYATWATYLADFVTMMQNTFGVPIYAVSVQNEPDESQPYPSCTWTAQNIHDFVPDLASAFTSAGVSPKIMIAEQSQWAWTYVTTAMADATVAAEVGILASHNYDGRDPTAVPGFSNLTNQHVWETEVSDFSSRYDGSITSGLYYADRMHSFLSNAQVNAWLYWEMDYTGSSPFCLNDNEGLTDCSGNIAKRAYVLGQWARFVRPGWHEVGVTNLGSLLVTAFQDPSSIDSAIVVVNAGSSPVSATFNVGAAMGASTIPYVTSATYSLAAQAPVGISGGSFTYEIPASSVTTFVSPIRRMGDMQPEHVPTPLRPPSRMP